MHKGEPPADEYRRGAHAQERVSHGARGVTKREHARPDQDERARPEAVRQELDGPGPDEHRQPVESDGEARYGGAVADALERGARKVRNPRIVAPSTSAIPITATAQGRPRTRLSLDERSLLLLARRSPSARATW